MPLTVADLMSKMPGSLPVGESSRLRCCHPVQIYRREPGDWYAAIKDDKVEVKQGVHEAPKMTLTADSSDYVKIFTGELDGMQAFMQGKLKLAGDLNLAMKLTQMFKIR